MRSDRSKRGLLIAILLLLAAIQIAGGTFAMLMYREYLTNPKDTTVVEDKDNKNDPATEDEDDTDVVSPGEDTPDIDEDVEDTEPEEDADEDDEDENDDKDKDDGDEEDDKDKDYIVMTVRASDNFAAVRAGRGTQYEEVGRITNGNKVALTDLKNGWYKIAEGEYKGYYTHESSYVKE